VEIAVGVGLVAGLGTSLAAAGLAATMAVAFGAIHRFAGFFVFARPDEGYEYVATLAVAALTLGTLGPGAVSVDSVIGLADMLDGWVGLAIVIGGLAAGVAQLAMFWRRPLDNNESTDKKEIDA
jgi:putative oxidoreductase